VLPLVSSRSYQIRVGGSSSDLRHGSDGTLPRRTVFLVSTMYGNSQLADRALMFTPHIDLQIMVLKGRRMLRC